tara:strand:- start:293 stop:988 length:696 start_codon:yes stop_codon:yes gene_type:complete
MYTLYHQDGTRSGAALLALAEGELVYEVRDVDISAYDHQREEFLKINPRGLIPTLLTDTGEVICETAAIMMYVADRHQLTELAPLAQESGRGALHDWLFYHVGEVQEAGKRNAYSNRYSTDIADASRIRDKATQTLLERWQIVDKHLAENGPYHLGERFSVVDLYLAITAAWLKLGDSRASLKRDRVKFSLEDLPAVKRCYDLVSARPKSKPILERHDSGLRALLARSLPE